LSSFFNEQEQAEMQTDNTQQNEAQRLAANDIPNVFI